MLHVILIPLLTALVVIGLTVLVINLTKRKQPTPDERLNKEYVYRKEPHADQVAEHPNRLSENDVTRG